ncbi:MAG: alpha/beta hydrolase [Acidimicrobiia bacterium]|nr:alpha/beta hydrolase [Acidimicrobiia bacterium]
MSTDFLDINGVRIRYQEAGQGGEVLLLHGWGARLETFHPLFQALSHGFRTVALDLPGHGESAVPPEPWHVSDFLGCVLAFMDRRNLEKPHIVAHSFGGRITIKLAALHPERAGRLLLTAAAGVPPRQSLRTRIRRMAGSTAGKLQRFARTRLPASEPLVRAFNARLLPRLASRDYLNAGAMRETLIHIVTEDLTAHLPRVQSPALLVWGDQDRDTPLECGRTMARLIPESELVVLEGAGHFPFLDQANKFNLLAQRFFSEGS